MNGSRSPIAWLAYLIIGIILLLIAVQILRGVLYLVYWLATLILSVALVFAVAWVVYALIKSSLKKSG